MIHYLHVPVTFIMSVSGTFTGLVTVQRSHDNGLTWHSAGTVLPAGAGPAFVRNAVNGAWYRAGFTATGFGGGSVNVELAQ